MNLRLVPRFCHIGYAISLDYYGQSERSWATSATVFSDVRLCPTASFFNSSLYCLRFPSMFSLTSFNLIIALNLVSNKAGEVHHLLPLFLKRWAKVLSILPSTAPKSSTGRPCSFNLSMAFIPS
jgi:hypothetical protein